MMLLFEVDFKKLALNRKMKIRIKYKKRHILLMKRLQFERLSSIYHPASFPGGSLSTKCWGGSGLH